MNHCCSGLIETSPAKPATVKTKKAKGISQYLLRFWLLLVRTATVRSSAATIRSHCSRRPSSDVCLFSATGIGLEQDHQRCSEKQSNRCVGGLAPIKGRERGWDFPALLSSLSRQHETSGVTGKTDMCR